MRQIERRKIDHLELFKDQSTQSRRSTLLECVELEHNAMPELRLEDIDTTVEFAGKHLQAPLMITAMTGGAGKAKEFNLAFAKVAQEFGIAMGLGSQRAMLEHPELAETFMVREVAPDILLAGNIGGAQLAQYDTSTLEDMLRTVGADALCVHLNPAQELVQPEGDTNFVGIRDSLAKLAKELPYPTIVKETGAGIGHATAVELVNAGIEYIDVSGLGGTSWVAVELLRSGNENGYLNQFWDWGIPTAEATIGASKAGATVIASGGIRTGLDVAKSIAIGATIAGFAAPIIQAYYRDGINGVRSFIANTIDSLRRTMLLCGARTIADLKQVKAKITGSLKERLYYHS